MQSNSDRTDDCEVTEGWDASDPKWILVALGAIE